MSVYPGLSLLTLGVSDVPRAADFYRRLGWRASQAASSASMGVCGLNNLALALYGEGDLRNECGGPARFRGQVMSQNHASAAGVDAALAAALRAGARLLRAAGPAPWGGYHAAVADPDGHVLEFAWNPALALGPDGSLVLPP
jgi:catechol 2,3-dioxygenase-like lactoylglutathione lyase family enzyme